MVEAVDLLETGDRHAIRAVCASLGIEPTSSANSFRCPNLCSCSAAIHARSGRFHTGTWPYVGAQYGNATIRQHVARILFIAMDRGGSFDPAEEPTFADTQSSFRTAAEERINPHMGGTAQIIVRLVDEPDPRKVLDAVRSNERRQMRRVHRADEVPVDEHDDRQPRISSPYGNRSP